MNNMYLRRIKRFIKDRIKKLITKKYRISVRNLFNRKRYYVIRRNSPWAGFFANYLYVLGHIIYAKKKKYIPVVDMENYPTYYNEKEKIKNTKNAWEYYFQQPENKSLIEAYSSKNYIISDISTMREYIPYKEGDNFLTINWEKGRRVSQYIQEYIRLNSEIENEILQYYNEKMKGFNVLGVHYRGTDKKNNVKNHYSSAKLDNYIESVSECLKENKVDKILLCTDEEEAVKIFEEKFPNKIIHTSSYRAKPGDTNGIHIKSKSDRKDHNYLLGKEVLIDTYLLSKCNYFVFSHSNVAVSALLINNEEYVKTYLVKDEK